MKQDNTSESELRQKPNQKGRASPVKKKHYGNQNQNLFSQEATNENRVAEPLQENAAPEEHIGNAEQEPEIQEEREGVCQKQTTTPTHRTEAVFRNAHWNR